MTESARLLSFGAADLGSCPRTQFGEPWQPDHLLWSSWSSERSIARLAMAVRPTRNSNKNWTNRRPVSSHSFCRCAETCRPSSTGSAGRCCVTTPNPPTTHGSERCPGELISGFLEKKSSSESGRLRCRRSAGGVAGRSADGPTRRPPGTAATISSAVTRHPVGRSGVGHRSGGSVEFGVARLELPQLETISSAAPCSVARASAVGLARFTATKNEAASPGGAAVVVGHPEARSATSSLHLVCGGQGCCGNRSGVTGAACAHTVAGSSQRTPSTKTVTVPAVVGLGATAVADVVIAASSSPHRGEGSNDVVRSNERIRMLL